MFNLPIPDDMHDYIDGEITFIGVVHNYWPTLSKYWNLETQKTYYKLYVDRIGPYLRRQALVYYNDVAYFDEVIEAIRKDGTRRNKKLKYSESTLHQFRYLMQHVVRIAARYENIPDIFLTEDDPGEKEDHSLLTDEVESRTRLQKSFSPYQEYILSSALFRDPLMAGYLVAALLMWVFGLRNKEACCLSWRNIIPMPEHPGWYVLVVYKSTVGNTTDETIGGKTSNMFRFLPIPPLVYDFLMQRKAYIQRQIDTGKIKLTKKIPSIEYMPIACKEGHWLTRCTSNQVTAICKQLFKDIGLTEHQIRYFSQKPDSSDTLGQLAWDKDPTAYTFRRNLATHLHILGYSPEEMQYMMGHKIENELYRRSDFSNPDMMYALFLTMTQRPIVNNIDFDVPIIEISEDYLAENITEATYRILGKNGVPQITVIPNSPYQSCKMYMKRYNTDGTTTLIPCTYQQRISTSASPKQSTKLYHYHNTYKLAYNRFMKAKRKKEEN